MRRRTFLIRLGAGFASAPAILALGGCSSNQNRTPSGEPDAGDGGGSGADAGASDPGFVVMNDDGSGHTHSFTIKCSHQEADGWTYTAEGAHTHEVWLSKDDLEKIFKGEPVTVETTDGHPHTWKIQLPSDTCDSTSDEGDDTGDGDTGGGPGGGGGGGY